MLKANKKLRKSVSKWFSRYLVLFVLLLLLFQFALLPPTNHEITPLIVSDTASEFEQEPNFEIHGTRNTREVIDDEPNDNPWEANFISSSSDNIVGSVSAESDPADWFKIEMAYESGKTVQNLTIMLNPLDPTPLTGDNNKYLQILVYGAYDINQDKQINWDTEMIFLKTQTYRIGSSSGETLFVNSFHIGHSYDDKFYYIMFRTDGAIAHYNFSYSTPTLTPPVERNQAIENADTLYVTTPEIHTVNLDTDIFDWFRIFKTPSKTAVGVNFTLNVKVAGCSPAKPVTVDGVPINIVTVLNILVYHEDFLGDGDAPGFPYEFRDHLRISLHPYTKLKYKTEYSDVLTLPTPLFKNTYLGFYVECYGIDNDHPEVKLYPVIEEIGEYTRGWCEFEIEKAESISIYRPQLSKIRVESTATHDIHGRTYDNYNYTVTYKQQNNYGPLMTEVSVFGLEGEIREKMFRMSTKTGSQNVYKDGCVYNVTISGLLLGEGNHHVFQLHVRDRNAWANGTIELGKSWHGPYISNNIRPYLRPTSPTSLTLYEDDNTTFFDLNTIFEDVDLKEELNFTITDPDSIPEERLWGKYFNHSKLEINIVNQSRLKIDLKPNKFGEVKLLLNVTDKKHYYLDPTFEFTVIILPVNDPPQVIEYFSSLIINEDNIYTHINLHEHFDDPIDHDNLIFRVDNNQHINVTINQSDQTAPTHGDVNITPEHNWFGTEYIYFYASDTKAEVSDYLKVIVKSVNDMPQLIINETIELWQDQWANFTITGLDIADNETIILSQNFTEIFPNLANKPELYGYSFDNISGYFTIKPTNGMVGTYSWNISATDIHNLTNFTHVTLIINNVNDPPVPKILFPAKDARYLATDKISFRGWASDPDIVLKIKGIESKPISFTWYSTVHGVRKRIGTGQNLEPQLYEVGTHTIKLFVNDGEFTNNASIVIHIFAINKDLDTDSDGIPDYWENLFNLNILDPNDAKDDFDKDTYSNWEEYKAQTDPRDPNSHPEEHITDSESEVDPYLMVYIVIFTILIVILAILVLYVVIKARRKKREDQESKRAELKRTAQTQRKTHGVYKQPSVICHNCGASLKIMTLNRPVAVTCNQCGSRGAVYK